MRSQSRARFPEEAAMPSEVLRELILKLAEPDRLEIIREAGMSDDRPSLLRESKRKDSSKTPILG
jgi:hypothetical protein